MNIKKYIAWRFVHMVVTLLIVLVLLFVLFRLMPGSAAQAYLVKPGISQYEKDRILIRYGMAKEVPMPGDYFKSTFQTPQIGRFDVTINGMDEDGQSSSVSTHFDVVADPTLDYAPPFIAGTAVVPPNPASGSSANITATVTDNIAVRSANAYIHPPSGATSRVVMNAPLATSAYSTTLVGLVDGRYYAEVAAMDISGNNGSALLSFGVGAGTPGPSIYALSASQSVMAVGDSTTVTVENELASPSLLLTRADGTNSTVALTATATPGIYQVVYTPPVAGDYLVRVSAGAPYTASMHLRVNPAASLAPAPVDSANGVLIDLVTECDTSGHPYELGPDGNVRVVINVTSEPWESMAYVNATVTSPDGMTHLVPMVHPTKVVPRAMYEQFVYYMKGMLVFDFGTSFETNRPVWDEILTKIPATLWLFGNALIFATVIGIAIGMIIAWRRGTALEVGTIIVTLFFYSMPIFWFGLLAQWIFYVQLGWFPLSGIGGTDSFGDALTGFSYVQDMVWHLVLPLATLTVLHLAGDILLMRTAMLEVLGEDFVTTARAKGLKERSIMYKHAARNAMLPVVTALAMSVSGVISGGVLTETIFSWPGMGSMIVRATLTQDYPVVQGVFYILAILTIVGNMAADVLYAYLDPRVQL